MVLAEFRKTRKIKKIIRRITAFLVEELKEEGLISLYLAGSILSQKERTSRSDIDFFGIVNEKFDFGLEEKVNRKLKKGRKSLCGGFELKKKFKKR